MDLTSVGIGLDHHDLKLGVVTDEWVEAGSQLRDQIASVLEGVGVDVEHIGSSAVLGLVAKPIIDLAVGASGNDALTSISDSLQAEGWIYRGDAGEEGGHVFVLESRPWLRVAHIHVVEHGGRQWSNYLRLREKLRSSAVARARYAAAKEALVTAGIDRRTYTEAKTEVVQALLASDGP